MGLGDAVRQRRLLAALLLEGGLDGAQGVHGGPQVAHDACRQVRARDRVGGVVHLLLSVKTARDGIPGGLQGAGELVGGGDAELGAREVELVGGGTHLLVCREELAVGLRDLLLGVFGSGEGDLLRGAFVATRGGGHGEPDADEAADDENEDDDGTAPTLGGGGAR